MAEYATIQATPLLGMAMLTNNGNKRKEED